MYQIWSGQFQTTYRPGNYLRGGQAAPVGWKISACIGAKLGRPDNRVGGVVGDYSFGFLEEIVVAVQYEVPFVLVMLNNAYMSLIRQLSKYIRDMDFGVDIGDEDPNDANGIDHVAVIEAMGAHGVRLQEPDTIAGAVGWTIAQSRRARVPAPVETMVARDAYAAMGAAIDNVVERMPQVAARAAA